jgi:hypothetical protein
MMTPERLQEIRELFQARPYNADRYHDELVAEIERLTRELEDAKSDLERLDGACWYCANPDIQDPWRHVHADKGGHWHHCIDPGDGLPSDCLNSDRLERIFSEHGFAELEAANARLREALALHHSMILCGEQPSDRSEAMFKAAIKSEGVWASQSAKEPLAHGKEPVSPPGAQK